LTNRRGDDAIPDFPVALTAEQAEIMEQRRIKKHHLAIVLLHWFNAMVWMAELSTGAALVVAPAYRFAPLWFLTLMEGIFGSRANLLRFHIAVGITWTVVLLVYAVFGYRRYFRVEILRAEMALDADDLGWLRIRLLRLLDRSAQPLPPQGSYNAGQKLFAFVVWAAVPAIIFTGLIMTFHWFGTTIVAWAMPLHFLAVGMVVSGLVIHIYMGAVFPEERPAFYSMVTGMVDELYAYRHHFKWWRDVKLQELAWDQELRAAEAQEGAQPKSTQAGAVIPAGGD
jgi:formate dehydrogenase subunit gamma